MPPTPTSSVASSTNAISKDYLEIFLSCFTPFLQALFHWIHHPNFWTFCIVFIVAFWVAVLVPVAAGFGSDGIRRGSLAAWFQYRVYGSRLPDSGIFAGYTSIEGRREFPPAYLSMPAVIIAFGVTITMWAFRHR